MITGVHTMFYSSDPGATRDFLRDKLGFSGSDVGDGWLIFEAPSADIGVHPSDDAQPHSKVGTHNISFFCEDIAGTVADLESRGVSFLGPIQDLGFGHATFFTMPGGITVQLYQPSYAK